MSSELSLAFIDHNPTAAARTLNGFSMVDAAVYLANIPVRYSVRLISFMNTWSAAQLIQAMPASSAGAILRSLPYLRGAAILRLVPPANRGKLLESLPRSLRKDFKTTMSYPSDTVGGQMALDMIVVEPGHSLADVRHALQKADHFRGDSVFVVDDRRRYLGSIYVSSLFSLAESSKMGDVPLLKAEPLMARQSIESAADATLWRESHYLPVAGRDQHMIGVLAMHQMFSAMSIHTEPENEQGVSHSLLEAYLDTARLLLTQLSGPKVPQNRAEHS